MMTEEKKKEQSREEILSRWENARRRKRDHVAKLEKELNEELVRTGHVQVKLEAW